MSQEENNRSLLTSEDVSHLPLRDRAGLVVQAQDIATVIDRIREAEQAGIRQVWMTQSAGMLDTLTIFAAAAVQTTQIGLGTSIVPVYPRHPLVMAQQAATIEALAPGRLRLGVGTSHRHVMENIYGLSMPSPLAYLREYVEVMREVLWEGRVDHRGKFFNVNASIPRPARVPLLISALGEKAFHLAGEVADGAISWVCPVPYLLDKALPALRAGAQASNRPAPPLVAHIPVAISTDEAAVQAAATPRISFYTRAPFYRHMFELAGFPIGEDGTGTSRLVQALVVAGEQARVEKRLRELLASGLDELLLMLVPVKDETREREQLMQVIASL
ncbi:MAG TPA: LLM class flavin-dependent oxidoreductase [Ktedonobacteraceae bacterium]|jgi:F420-dependent oxidoreductase-like protein|nr:LLM class flavin-dependent oxidoreductase [Ktedonobacteraceae bacterium]